MERLRGFQTAARKSGFVKVSESAGGTVLWFRRRATDTVRNLHQSMCIDTLTNSVTVYWMTDPGRVSSTTFRGVLALQEWLERRPQAVMER
jgi:hypothetical protein